VRNRVAILGDINRDLILRVRALPKPGHDCLAESATRALGGSAVNTAACLARLGVPASILGRVGNDAEGRALVREMAEIGIDTRAVEVDGKRSTGLCAIPVSANGERTLIGFRGANLALGDNGLARALPGIRHLHVSGYALLERGSRRAALEALKRARRAGATTSLDFGWQVASGASRAIRRALAQVTVALPSGEELRMALGERQTTRAARKALRLGAKQVAASLGPRGCQVFLAERSFRIPSFPVQIVNSCGAGDAFNAGYIYGLLRSTSPEICAIIANAAGGAAVASEVAHQAVNRRRLNEMIRRAETSVPWRHLAGFAREARALLLRSPRR